MRHLVDHSSAIVAMSWHGYHSLVTAYGVPESKVRTMIIQSFNVSNSINYGSLARNRDQHWKSG